MKSYHDIVGDGGSRVLEQVLEKRGAIRSSLTSVRRVVAVGSGKGGVGKSTLTRALAVAAARRGRRVAILDADLNGPSQLRFGGAEGRPPVPGRGGMTPVRTRDGVGLVSVASFLGPGQALDFEAVSAGDSHTWRATREFTLLGDLLAGVEWGDLDLLLVDLPPGPERTAQLLEFLGPEVDVVLVTIPSRVSRDVVARCVAAIAPLPNRTLGLVTNMAAWSCPDCGGRHPLFRGREAVEGAGPLSPLGEVPFDADLGNDLDEGRRLGDSPAFVAVSRIADTLFADAAVGEARA